MTEPKSLSESAVDKIKRDANAFSMLMKCYWDEKEKMYPAGKRAGNKPLKQTLPACLWKKGKFLPHHTQFVTYLKYAQ